MITLYPYQEQIVNKIRKRMTEGHKHICVQSPTGSGKTVIFSYIVSEMTRRKKRALILTDRIELLTETGGTLEQFNLRPYLITSGQMAAPPKYYSCHVAMAQTLRLRIDMKHRNGSAHNYAKDWQCFFKSFDLIIIDECHKQEFNPFFADDCTNSLTEQSKNVFNGAYVLGFTATPKRTGKQRQLAQDYSCLVTGPTVEELIALKKLLPDKYYGVDVDTFEDVQIDKKTGDYDEGSIYAKFNRPELYDGCVDEWLKNTPDTITLCFCVNIKHSIETCKRFNESGIKAKFLVSDVAKPKLLGDNPTPGQISRYEYHLENYNAYCEAAEKWSGKREKVIEDWERGKFQVLVNAGILTTGFNFPPIETIIINRATLSDNLWLQMVGRGSRTWGGGEIGGYMNSGKLIGGKLYPEKQYFNILDFGSHGTRLGYYRDKREYSLIHEQPNGGGVAPVKECGKQSRSEIVNGKAVKIKPDILTGYTPDKSGRPGCGAYINASMMICPYCGYTYQTEKEKIIAELKLIDYTILPENGKVIAKPNKYNEIEQTAESKGYKPGWIALMIGKKYGYGGLSEYAKQKGYSSGWAWRMAKQYKVPLSV